MQHTIAHQTFDAERSLYNLKDTLVQDCTFAGPADGESVLKEARNIIVDQTRFSLRYPLWHVQKYELLNSSMDEATRAPIWYSNDGLISGCTITGIKCLRECQHTRIQDSTIKSPEFGWKCHDVEYENTAMESEYFMFDSSDIRINHMNFKGKYSFQYVNNLHITNSNLDTKDAFWHSKNITVEDSIVKGEYLGWFSEGLTLIRCHIIGTQPLCYCKDLKLIDCTMEGTDLAFEYSDVEATVKGHILSVKNPKSGTITADSVGEIIHEDPIMECTGQVILRGV